MKVLGIDIGGSAIKGALVDTETGLIISERVRIKTPPGARPEPMIEIIAEIARKHDWKGPIGCGYPGVVRHGTTLSAANVSKKWVEFNAERRIAEATDCPVRVVNDADAAGLAEMRFGAGRGRSGVVIMVTIGTGLGTALFTDGYLLPNAELGHIEIDGQDAESRASDATRKREKLSWKEWGKRFNRYLNTLHFLFTPDLFILGGGTSNKYDQFNQYINVPAEVVTALMLNDAGIVGAALAGVMQVNDTASPSPVNDWYRN